jgi:antitoxin component YwqK of YwqJK toxin-antitoxin module
MKKILTILLAFSCCCANRLSAQSDESSPTESISQPAIEQDTYTLYLDAMLNITSEDKSAFKLVLKKIAGNSFNGTIFNYMDKVKAKGIYLMMGKVFLEDGHFTYYYEDGLIESEGEFDRGVKVGTWKRFDRTGKRKTDKYYPPQSADKIRESMEIIPKEKQ